MATVELPSVAPPEARRRRFGWAGRAVWAAVGAVAALAATVTPVLDWAYPDLKADPQMQLEGGIGVTAVERGVTYGGYLLRAGMARRWKQTAPAERNANGVLVYVRLELKGLKRMWGTLRWYGYDAQQRHRLFWEDDPSRGSRRIRGGTTSDRFMLPIWVQVPPSGKYFVRFELRARGVLLSMVDTKPL